MQEDSSLRQPPLLTRGAQWLLSALPRQNRLLPPMGPWPRGWEDLAVAPQPPLSVSALPCPVAKWGLEQSWWVLWVWVPAHCQGEESAEDQQTRWPWLALTQAS